MNAICKQFETEIDRFKIFPKSIQTLFIGGGTPSCVNYKLYEPFFNLIAPYLMDDIEITVEANPNSATKEWLEGMRDFGINRISFGVQSFDNEKLRFLNRAHTKKQAIKAIINAKKTGFLNISVDLIYATSLDSIPLLSSDLDIAFQLPINHLSAYSLTIEEDTKFFTTPNVKVDDEKFAYFIIKEIQRRGFKQYEISNFGLYQSKHNLGYWKYQDYIGIGSGSVGFLKDRRFYALKDPIKYIQNPTEREIEKLSEEDIISEKVLLGARSDVGIDSTILNQTQLQKAHLLAKNGKLFLKDSIFYNQNYLLSDEIALYILDD